VYESIACYRKAIDLNPKDANAHNGLGFALDAAGKQKEAIEAWRTAVRLEPSLAVTHYWLGKALLRQGRPSEALVPLDEAARRLPAEQAQDLGLRAERSRAERLSGLEKRLPDLLAGKDRLGDNSERFDLIELCRLQHRFAAAVRFFTQVFAADAKLADDLTAAHRYHAACSAAQAGFGQGNDASKLTDSQRRALRRQALTWLRADLLARLRPHRPETLPQAVKAVLDWQTDPALACLREGEALERLGTEERQACQRLWSDIDRLVMATPQGQQAKGEWHAARREWLPAARCYAGVLKQSDTDDGHFWFEYASLLLLSGDGDGYCRACTRMIARCGKARDMRAYHVARARTLSAASRAELDAVARLAAGELNNNAREFWSLLEQGALAQRAGQAEKAIGLLKSSLAKEQREGNAMVIWLWLALAEQAREQPTVARRWLGRASAVLDRHAVLPAADDGRLGMHLHNWLEAHVLRQQVEVLLKSSK
jgi:tetratricopeptide (TPR) repeat protein